MSNSTNSQTERNSSVPTAAYAFVALGGGVVGHDYARTFDVDPMIGSFLGGLVSAGLIKLLYYLYSDPEGHIKQWLTGIGAVIGAILGFLIASNDPSITMNPFILGGIIAIIGAGLGQLAAAAISIFAVVLLLASQGPVGLMIRTAILEAGQ